VDGNLTDDWPAMPEATVSTPPVDVSIEVRNDHGDRAGRHGEDNQ
jgi:hypothetical protein